MKALLAASLLLPAISFASGVAGFWKGETFSITAVGNKVTGYWGDKNYQVQLLQDGYRGTINNNEIKIDFWDPDVKGKLSCGDIQINAWETEVEGVICGQSFTTATGNQHESDEIAYETADTALMDEFPVPAHGTIRSHIKWFRGEGGGK